MIWRLLTVAVVTLGGVVGLRELADATRNEGDRHVRGTTSVVVLDVDTRGRDPALAATGLWSVCHLTIPAVRLVSPPAPVLDAPDDGWFSVTVTPALGENDQRRLRGCLADGTVDRVWAEVVSID